MQSVTKAVVPCGGCGTRFLPITKAVAKEMYPVVDKPCLDYIVDELIESGITDILFVVSPDKDSIRRYYGHNERLSARLGADGKTRELQLLRALEAKARFSFVEQSEPKGSGDAILLAEEFCAGQPFVIALGDDLMHAAVPVTKQLLQVWHTYGRTVLGVQRRTVPEILRYGVIRVREELGGGSYAMDGVLEKPTAEQLTSDLATLGRYVVDPAIFDVLRHTPVGIGGELQLTDALDRIAHEKGAIAHVFDGKRYDLGDKLGSIEAIVDYTLERDDLGEAFAAFLRERVGSL